MIKPQLSPRRRALRVGALALATALAISIWLASAAGASSSPPTPEVTTLQYEAFPTVLNVPELAEELGFLGPLKLHNVGGPQNGPQEIEALQSGDLDFAGSFNGGIISAVNAGAKITAVVAYLGDKGIAAGGIYVPKSSSITTASDLVGKPVAYYTGTLAASTVETYLLKNGLKPSQVTPVSLTGLGEIQALKSGEVAAAYLVGTEIAEAKSEGAFRALATEDQLYGQIGTCSYVFSNDFIKKNPNTVRLFVSGVAKALAWVQQHTRQQVIAEYTKFLNSQGRTSDAAAFKYWEADGVPTNGGLIRPQDFSVFSNWLQNTGLVKKGDVDLNTIYTNKFNPDAQ